MTRARCRHWGTIAATRPRHPQTPRRRTPHPPPPPPSRAPAHLQSGLPLAQGSPASFPSARARLLASHAAPAQLQPQACCLQSCCCFPSASPLPPQAGLSPPRLTRVGALPPRQQGLRWGGTGEPVVPREPPCPELPRGGSSQLAAQQIQVRQPLRQWLKQLRSCSLRFLLLTQGAGGERLLLRLCLCLCLCLCLRAQPRLLLSRRDGFLDSARGPHRRC